VLLATSVLIDLPAGLLGVCGTVAVPVLIEVLEVLGMAGPASIAIGAAQAGNLIASAMEAAVH
jgi:hypothetical protein